jgi:hypothetical protein
MIFRLSFLKILIYEHKKIIIKKKIVRIKRYSTPSPNPIKQNIKGVERNLRGELKLNL